MKKKRYIATDETKERISKALKGKHFSPLTEYKKGIYQGYGFKKGYKMSVKIKNKISKTAKENGIGKWMTGRKPHNKNKTWEETYGIKKTKEMKDNLKENARNNPNYGWKNKKIPSEIRKKMSLARIGFKPKKESIEKMRLSKIGKKQSKESNEKRSISLSGKNNPMFGRSRELCPAWKGGLSFESYGLDWTKTLKRAIRERDKCVCKICGNCGLDIHHIDYDKKNCNPDNLITLCRSCHIKTNANRKKWTWFLNSILQDNKNIY